ncbi:unnamed protein product [Coregonus sp. 'balchen']|nr:unnamed protein product [Coregonus sp. 'balchen']
MTEGSNKQSIQELVPLFEDNIKQIRLQQQDINKNLRVSLTFVLDPSRTERQGKGAVVRISNFLGKKLDDQTIDIIVDKSSFKNMKEDPQARRDKQHPAFFEQSGSFIRNGTVGDWKTMFTVAQSERFDEIYMEKMKDLPLEFDWEL